MNVSNRDIVRTEMYNWAVSGHILLNRSEVLQRRFVLFFFFFLMCKGTLTSVNLNIQC